MTKTELISGLDKDLADLRQAHADRETLLAGGTVENLTLTGCEGNIIGLTACIEHKRAMLAEVL